MDIINVESRKPIMLNDLLHFDEKDFDHIKAKFNIPTGEEDPLELFLTDPEVLNTQWFLWHNQQRYFQVGQTAICFVRMIKRSPDSWLLTTIKHIDNLIDTTNGIGYEATELDEYRQYYGRVIVRWRKTTRTEGLYYRTFYNEAEVEEVLNDDYAGEEFPGYDQVRITWEQLHSILSRAKSEWRGALRSQKAVYVITDLSNGKLYVGSATSKNGMLLDRWSAYADNGHGGNKELKAILSEDPNYAKMNFQYSILENYDSSVPDEFVLERERHWKRVLDTYNHGYNANY